MRGAVHQYEDKLLEFAYGELSRNEADAVEAHVRECHRCAQSLSEIKGVRLAMAQLPQEEAPEAGLKSLEAYAEQAAKRAADAKPTPSLWKRFLMPLSSVMVMATVGVVAFRAHREVDTSPASVAADAKLMKEQEPQGDYRKAAPTAPAPAAPPQPLAQALAAPSEQERQEEATAAVEARAPKSSPQWAGSDSETRRRAPANKATDKDLARPQLVPAQASQQAPAGDDSVQGYSDAFEAAEKKEKLRDDYSNAALRGARGKEPSKKALPLEESGKSLQGFGLGTGSSLGGVSPGSSSAPAVRLEKKTAESPSAAEPMVMKADSVSQDDAKDNPKLKTKSLESARAAAGRGDRGSEVQLWTQVLESGATGSERVEALKGLCDAYEALGEFERADPFCDQLLAEFPKTAAARAVENRRGGAQSARSSKAAGAKQKVEVESGEKSGAKKSGVLEQGLEKGEAY